MSDVTNILQAMEQGDHQAAAQLLPLVYQELRQLAAQKLAQEKPGQTLDATALVHEAYVRLVASDEPSSTPNGAASALRPDARREFTNRRHFFLAAAEAMRRILVDNARRKRRPKHGGDRRRVDLPDHNLAASGPVDLVAIHEALDRLETFAPDKAHLVKLRFFVGMTMPEAAQTLDISLATAERWWTFARTWLFAALNDTDLPEEKNYASHEGKTPDSALKDNSVKE